MNVSVNVKVTGTDPWVATVRVVQEGRHSEHRVTVTGADLERYGASDAKGLVHRSFVFLLGREPNTSILPEFRITEIERHFPEFRKVIAR
jgi:hypothetical protein